MQLEDLLDYLPLPGRMPRDQVTGRTFERTYARSDEFELGRTVYKEPGLHFSSCATVERGRIMTPHPETSNGAALELVETAYLSAESEPDLSDQMEGWSLEYKCDVRSWLDTLTAKVREVKAYLDQDIASELGENNAIRIADRVFRAQQGGTWKVTEDAANDGSLAAWIDDVWHQVVNLKAQGAITKGRLEAIAKEVATQEGFDPGTVAYSAVDEFMTREPSGGPVTVLPIEKAPKFLQKLDHGDTLYPVGKKELE